MNYEELKNLMKDQKEEMTPTERMRAYMAGETVDILPYSLLGDGPAMADIFGFTTRQAENDPEIAAEIIRDRKSVV